MLFKRREKPGFWTRVWHAIWPRSGWARATRYVILRLTRLPGSPEEIARGVAAGVFVSFTPFFGLHFVTAALLAWAMRGNILAAILGTFFGNPLTFPFIAALNLELGSWILDVSAAAAAHSLPDLFKGAFFDLWNNAWAMFTGETVDWSGFREFLHGIFLPYLVGGIGPGVVFAVGSYYVSVPLIAAYQHRRKGRLKEKWEEIRARRAAAKLARAAEREGGMESARAKRPAKAKRPTGAESAKGQGTR